MPYLKAAFWTLGGAADSAGGEGGCQALAAALRETLAANLKEPTRDTATAERERETIWNRLYGHGLGFAAGCGTVSSTSLTT